MSDQMALHGDVAPVAEKQDAITKQEIALPQLSPKQARIASFTPTNLTEAIALAKLMANSGVVPKEFKGKPADVLVAMQLGSELGLAPLQALQGVAIINGRPTIWGDTALAVVQAHPFYEWHREEMEGTGDSRVAICKVKRRGSEMHLRRFAVADAKKAGLWNKPGPWQQYPDRMLQLRARGFALRDQFADALRGMNLTEEIMDVPQDTSEAKKQREAATLDIGVSNLQPSSEPNRGHSDTGLEKPAAQGPAKAESAMCGDCGKIDGHEPGCKYAAQDAKTSKPMNKDVFLVLGATRKTKKSGEPYLVLECVDRSNQQGKLYVWHQSFFEYLEKVADKNCMFEYSAQKKGNSTYHQVEHILEIAGTKFVNDKPAVEAEMPTDTAVDEDDDF